MHLEISSLGSGLEGELSASRGTWARWVSGGCLAGRYDREGDRAAAGAAIDNDITQTCKMSDIK